MKPRLSTTASLEPAHPVANVPHYAIAAASYSVLLSRPPTAAANRHAGTPPEHPQRESPTRFHPALPLKGEGSGPARPLRRDRRRRRAGAGRRRLGTAAALP